MCYANISIKMKQIFLKKNAKNLDQNETNFSKENDAKKLIILINFSRI